MSGTKIDTRARAMFREWARKIILDDRIARKCRRSQNTIGIIERALIDAFQMGKSGFVTFEDNSMVADWIQIPPRGRDVLWTISIPLRGNRTQSREEPIILEHIIVDGRARWRLLADYRHDAAHTFSTGGVNPLVKMGLLAVHCGRDSQLILTSKGVATCKEYWRRWDENDPTLPIIGMRP